MKRKYFSIHKLCYFFPQLGCFKRKNLQEYQQEETALAGSSVVPTKNGDIQSETVDKEEVPSEKKSLIDDKEAKDAISDNMEQL